LQAVQRRCTRIGLLLLFGRSDELGTPNGRVILASLRALLLSSGVQQALHLEGQRELLDKLDPATRARVQRALNPPELLAPEYQGITASQVQAEVPGGFAGRNNLPPVGSPAAQATVARERQASRYRGPADWPV